MENKLYSKLLLIQDHVDSFCKNKSTNTYKYVDGNTVLNEIRPLMNANKLILKQEILSIDNTRQDYQTLSKKDKSEILSKVMMRFTWVDCETGEKDENLFGANGMNDWDKGVGSALTYGERYFLLKFFHVPTDADDNDERTRKREEEEKKKQPQIIMLSEATFNKAIESTNIEAVEAVITKYSQTGLDMNANWRKQLQDRLAMLKNTQPTQ
jgi:hypothetical protein